MSTLRKSSKEILGGRSAEQVAGTVGDRFGKEKRFGALFGVTWDYNGRGIDDIEPTPDAVQNPDGSLKLTGASYFFFFVKVMLVTAVLFLFVSRFYRGKTYIQDEGEAQPA